MFSFEAWWQILTTKLPVFFQGVGTTVELALCTAIFGTLLGIVVALLRMSRVKLLKVLAGAYIEFLRGTPLLVQVLIVFYGLPQMGVKLPRMTAGTVALVINSQQAGLDQFPLSGNADDIRADLLCADVYRVPPAGDAGEEDASWRPLMKR